MAVDLVRNPISQLFNRSGNEDLDTRLIFTEADASPHHTRKIHPLSSERLLNLFNAAVHHSP